MTEQTKPTRKHPKTLVPSGAANNLLMKYQTPTKGVCNLLPTRAIDQADEPVEDVAGWWNAGKVSGLGSLAAADT